MSTTEFVHSYIVMYHKAIFLCALQKSCPFWQYGGGGGGGGLMEDAQYVCDAGCEAVYVTTWCKANV